VTGGRLCREARCSHVGAQLQPVVMAGRSSRRSPDWESHSGVASLRRRKNPTVMTVLTQSSTITQSILASSAGTGILTRRRSTQWAETLAATSVT
jgi:hypothetical protein